MAIAAIMSTVEIVKYVPTGSCGTGVAVGVGSGADSTYTEVSAKLSCGAICWASPRRWLG